MEHLIELGAPHKISSPPKQNYHNVSNPSQAPNFSFLLFQTASAGSLDLFHQHSLGSSMRPSTRTAEICKELSYGTTCSEPATLRRLESERGQPHECLSIPTALSWECVCPRGFRAEAGAGYCLCSKIFKCCPIALPRQQTGPSLNCSSRSRSLVNMRSWSMVNKESSSTPFPAIARLVQNGGVPDQ